MFYLFLLLNLYNCSDDISVTTKESRVPQKEEKINSEDNTEVENQNYYHTEEHSYTHSQDVSLINEEIDENPDMLSGGASFLNQGDTVGNLTAGGDINLNYAPTRVYQDNRQYQYNDKETTTVTNVNAHVGLW